MEETDGERLKRLQGGDGTEEGVLLAPFPRIEDVLSSLLAGDDDEAVHVALTIALEGDPKTIPLVVTGVERYGAAGWVVKGHPHSERYLPDQLRAAVIATWSGEKGQGCVELLRRKQ
jgi:hypothetical protein